MKIVDFLPFKRHAMIVAVILAGLVISGPLKAQSGTSITSFNFTLNPSYPSTINNINGTVAVPVYHTAPVDSLVAVFTLSPGAVARVNGVLQTSGVDYHDYTSGVTFDITSGDGLYTRSYVVTVTANAALSDKQLLSFSFDGIEGATGVINENDYTVQVTVPYSQDLAHLVATFSSSLLSTVKVGDVVQKSGVTENDFSSTVTYSVYAENGSMRNYYVNVSHAAASTENDMLSFSITNLDPAVVGTIDQGNNTISLTVPYSTDLTGLVATFASSPNSTVKIGSTVQVSGVTSNNFSSMVTYTVVAENGIGQNYFVTVTRETPSSAKDLTSFSFQGLVPPVVGSIVGQNITLTVPYGTALGALVATFTSSPLSTVKVGSVVQVSGSTTNNFGSDVLYTVVAEDETTKDYTVHVDVTPALTGKQILTFAFAGLDPQVTGTIDQDAKTIALTVLHSTDLTTLVPTFTSSEGSTVLVGATVQESGVSSQDFTNPVVYTCKAQDGTSQDYTVTVTQSPASQENTILTFNFEIGFDPDIIGTIDQTNKTIALTVPNSTDVTSLVATFTSSPFSTVKVGDNVQTSGVTSNDFTNPVQYTCVAEDNSTEIYTVTVTRAPKATGDFILSFNFAVGFEPDIIGRISGNTVTLTVPYTTDVTHLVATFTISPYATLKIGTTTQVSGVTSNNFTSPVEYICYAEDGSYNYYTVTVVKAPLQTGKEITEYRFNALDPDVIGTINNTNHTITLDVLHNTNVTNLVATFTASTMATVKVGTVVQVSGVTPNDFTHPVVYTVTAEDGNSQTYTVTVNVLPLGTGKTILTYGIKPPGLNVIGGTIDEAAKTIHVTMPYATPLTALVASFTVSPRATVKVGTTVQVSGVTPNDFTHPVVYTVIAENGDNTQYTVTVDIYIMPKAFLTFRFDTYTVVQGDSLHYTANGTINTTTHVIQVNIPFSARRDSMVPIFTLTDHTRALIGTVPQVSNVTWNNYTSTRSYTLIADDNSQVEYQVTVTNNPVDTQKQILTFAFDSLTPPVTAVVNEAEKTIHAVVPYGTDRTAMMASFTVTSSLTRVKVAGVKQVSGVTANDFTNPLVYSCFDEAGNVADYTVTVVEGSASTAKDITYFAFEDLNPDVVGVINQQNLTISATVPNGTRRDSLKAYFTSSPYSTVKVQGVEQQSGVTVNNFRYPVVYQVYAQDGSMKVYTVSVGESADTTKPVVTNAQQTVTNLPGQYVLVRSNEPVGKVYIIKNNVIQQTIADLDAAVAGGNGRSVYVTAANTDLAISTANLPEGTYYAYAIDAAGNKSNRGVNSIIILDRIAPTVFVEAQTRLNSLHSIVNIQSSEANSLVYLVLEGVPQLSKIQMDSAITAKKAVRGLVMYANTDVPVSVYNLVPGKYHAYAVDLSAANNVSAQSTNEVIINEADHFKSILAFSFNELDPPAIGQITGSDITVKVPEGTDLTGMVATFVKSPLSKVYVGLIEQQSGVTPNDFTSPVVYRVVAQDETSSDYTVTVTYNTGVGDIPLGHRIKAYPNPFSDRLVIESDRLLDRVVIVNALGQTVFEQDRPSSTVMEIPTGSWTQGIYFIRYYTDDQYAGSGKIIKD